MAINLGTSSDEDEVNSSINTTPLVDIMLVLLIIFLVTIPVALHTVDIQLPVVSNIPTETKPENILLAVDSAGNIYWNDQEVPTTEILLNRLKQVAVIVPQPEVHIRGDGNARFESVGRVLAALQRASIFKVGFITNPERGNQ